MNKINNEQLYDIVGGNSTASFINALFKIVDLVFEVGKHLGSTLNRTINGNTCNGR